MSIVVVVILSHRALGLWVKAKNLAPSITPPPAYAEAKLQLRAGRPICRASTRSYLFESWQIVVVTVLTVANYEIHTTLSRHREGRVGGKWADGGDPWAMKWVTNTVTFLATVP